MDDTAILKSYKIIKPELLGKGAQSRTYDYTDHEVVRIIDKTSIELTQRLKSFYDKVNSKAHVSFSLPEILEIKEFGEQIAVIEKKLIGQRADRLIAKLNVNDKQIALQNYINALLEIKNIEFDSEFYGELLIENRKPITANSWVGFIKSSVEFSYQRSLKDFEVDLPDHKAILDKYLQELENYEFKDHDHLVHGDYYFENIFMTDDMKVSALFDFSALTVYGDWRMDLGGAIDWMNQYEFIDTEDYEFTREYLTEKLGNKVSEEDLLLYKIFYSFRFSDCKQDDPKIYEWSINHLTNYLQT